MNTKIKNLNTLKTLPLIAALAIGLALSPTISMADKGDRGGHKNKYSHDDRQSHSKGDKRSNTHSNRRHYKSRDNSHKSNHGYRSKHRNNKGYGHHNDHVYYKRNHHHGHRDHHTTYVVNDYHYSDHSYGLDPLRFMIGLHTDNVDIIFRD